MAANPKETTAIIRENAADHALRPLFMRFEWTRCIVIVFALVDGYPAGKELVIVSFALHSYY